MYFGEVGCNNTNWLELARSRNHLRNFSKNVLKKQNFVYISCQANFCPFYMYFLLGPYCRNHATLTRFLHYVSHNEV
jgi:hypothetical protein